MYVCRVGGIILVLFCSVLAVGGESVMEFIGI